MSSPRRSLLSRLLKSHIRPAISILSSLPRLSQAWLQLQQALTLYTVFSYDSKTERKRMREGKIKKEVERDQGGRK